MLAPTNRALSGNPSVPSRTLTGCLYGGQSICPMVALDSAGLPLGDSPVAARLGLVRRGLLSARPLYHIIDTEQYCLAHLRDPDIVKFAWGLCL